MIRKIARLLKSSAKRLILQKKTLVGTTGHNRVGPKQSEAMGKSDMEKPLFKASEEKCAQATSQRERKKLLFCFCANH